LHWLSKKPICEGGNTFTSTSRGGGNKSLHEGRQYHGSKPSSGRLRKGGAANYPMGFVKRVARMPASERRKILKVLNRHKRQRRVVNECTQSMTSTNSTSEASGNSSSSVSKDWENWVLVRGKTEKVMEDVKNIGRVAGLTFECETKNCFSLLTREGRREWRSSGAMEVIGSLPGDGYEVEGC